MVVSDFVSRAQTSLSPDLTSGTSSQVSRPRKIKLPPVFNPDCLFTAKTSKSLLSRIKHNLSKLCEVDSTTSAAVELLKWTGKFSAEIMDLCKIELVQIEGLFVNEGAPI